MNEHKQRIQSLRSKSNTNALVNRKMSQLDGKNAHIPNKFGDDTLENVVKKVCSTRVKDQRFSSVSQVNST